MLDHARSACRTSRAPFEAGSRGCPHARALRSARIGGGLASVPPRGQLRPGLDLRPRREATELDAGGANAWPSITYDGRTLVFSRLEAGVAKIMRAVR